MITINLQTKEEAQVLVNLINIAVQTKGLEAAEAGVYFTKLIKTASETPTSDIKPSPEPATN